MAHQALGAILRHVRHLLGTRAGGDVPDRQLLERFAGACDEAAFEILVQRHAGMVMGVCRRLLSDAHAAEDAFQATFLVLARRAGAVRWHDSIANWLYGVAHRVAVKARTNALRRQAREQQGTAMAIESYPSARPSDVDPAAETGRRELHALLDEELTRLPDRFRAPLVLCYLEGKTNEEAAQELGWPAGSMSRRLGQARELLRERLVRRGVALSVTLLGTALAEAGAAPAPPGEVIATTVKAAALVAAGKAAAEVVSPEAAALAEGVVRAMIVNKVRLTAAVLLTLAGLSAGAGGVWHQVSAQPAESNLLAGHADADGNLVAAAPAEAVPVRPDETNPARVARKRLAERINLPKGIEPNTPLKEALEYLAKEFKVNIVLDEVAFAAIGVQKAGEQVVQLPPLTNVRLATVLRLLLQQIKGDEYSGGYLVRPDGIEVTTTYKVLQAVLGSSLARDDEEGGIAAAVGQAAAAGKKGEITDVPVNLDTVVHVEFDNRPLNEALKDLAEAEGVNIVIDPRVGEKAKMPVTLTLNNALFDTAVRVLTEMADLKAVNLTNVLFITTKENAAALKAEQSKRRYRRVDAPGGPSGM